ncbi:MAG: lipopolysaccharide biosynthesis protein [Acidimicrobiales bacterium]
MANRRLARDALAYTIGGTLQLLATLLLLPIATRVLPEDEYGFVVLLQLVTLVSVLAGGLGFPVAAMREYFTPDGGVDRARRVVASTVPAAALVAIVGSIGFVIWQRSSATETATTAVLLSIAVSVPRALVASGLGYIRSNRDVRSFLGISIVNTIGAQLAGVAVAFVAGRTATNFMLGFVVGSAVAALWTWVACGRPLGLLAWPQAREVFRYSLPIVPAALATLVLQAGDRLVVQASMGSVEVGRYQVGYLLASLAVPALVAFNNAWGPQLAEASENGSFGQALDEPISAIVLGASWAGTCCAVLAPAMIAQALPKSYDADGLRVVIAIVAASSFWFAIYVVATQVLAAARRTKILAVATPLATAINVGLNLWLVPRYGLEGAAAATTVAYVFLAVVATMAARTIHRYPLDLVTLGGGVAAGIYGAAAIPIGTDSARDVLLRAIVTIPALVVLGLVARKAMRPAGSIA